MVAVAGGSSWWWQFHASVAVAVAVCFAYFVQAPSQSLAGAMPDQGGHPEALLFVLLLC